jgi:hypothetical protein
MNQTLSFESFLDRSKNTSCERAGGIACRLCKYRKSVFIEKLNKNIKFKKDYTI